MADNPGLIVPTELVEMIAQVLLEQRQSPRESGLLTLTRISSNFYHAALPFVYRNIHLRNARSTLGCLRAICSNDHAAASVQHLDMGRVLFYHSGLSASRVTGQVEGQLLSRALSRMPRLTSLRFELELAQFSGYLNPDNTKELIQEVFGTPNQYPFQLRTFATNASEEHISQIKEFLEAQPSIENLSYRVTKSRRFGWGDWTTAPLPNLRQLATSAHKSSLDGVLRLIRERPLEHVFFDFTAASEPSTLGIRQRQYEEIMPTLIRKEGLFSATFRGELTELGRFVFFRDLSQDSVELRRKTLRYISIILEESREEKETQTFHVMLAPMLVSMSGNMPLLTAIFVNTIPWSHFPNIMGQFTVLATDMLAVIDDYPSFAVYFYDDLAKAAQLLEWRDGEWVMEEISYWDIPNVPGMTFTWKEIRADVWDDTNNLAI